MEYNPTDPNPEDVEVLVDDDGSTRQELWTDGEWIRLGRDVLGDRYFEAKTETFRSFIDSLRAQSGIEYKTVTDSRGCDVTLIIDAGYELDIYCDRKHILYHREHEYSVLYTALGRANDKRQTFDYESLLRSYVESVIPSYWRVKRIDERCGSLFTVEVGSDSTIVDFEVADTLEQDEFISFEEPQRLAHFDAEDGEIVYRFELDGADLRERDL
jgi:hypothetical protein